MRSEYDAGSRTVRIAPGASLYTRFHEEAHREQHETRSASYCIWYVLAVFRLRWLADVIIEYDALRRTRRAMKVLGLWNEAREKEARRGLRSYCKRQEDNAEYLNDAAP